MGIFLIRILSDSNEILYIFFNSNLMLRDQDFKLATMIVSYPYLAMIKGSFIIIYKFEPFLLYQFHSSFTSKLMIINNLEYHTSYIIMITNSLTIEFKKLHY